MSVALHFLDTNTVIYFFRGEGKVSERLLALPPKAIALSSIVVYELKVGIAKSNSPDKRRSQLKSLLDAVSFFPFSQSEAESAAEIRADLEKKGTPIGPHDILIAAVAKAHGGVLITRNQREFSRIGGLRLDDWY